MMRIVVGITGASGMELALRVMQAFKAHEVELHVIVSKGAKLAMECETDLAIGDFRALADAMYAEDDLAACLASGSFETDGMVVVPCSMKTLSGIANAYDENLVVRAADVCMKERRRLVLVPRETPLSNAHLRNMLTVSQDGAVIVPPMLSFYLDDTSLEGQMNQIVGKVLMQFGLKHDRLFTWEKPNTAEFLQS